MRSQTVALAICSACCLIVMTGCMSAPPPPAYYYTSTSSTGYTEQAFGGMCEKCGKLFQFSVYQLNNITLITCPYCTHQQNTKLASSRWVAQKNNIEQQNTQRIIGSIIIGLTQGLARSNTYNYRYTTSECMSDFVCSFGQKCVKAPFETSGKCMNIVNEYGIQVMEQPSTDSVGVNMDTGCYSDVNCPIGFRCDTKYKACVK